MVSAHVVSLYRCAPGLKCLRQSEYYWQVRELEQQLAPHSVGSRLQSALDAIQHSFATTTCTE